MQHQYINLIKSGKRMLQLNNPNSLPSLAGFFNNKFELPRSIAITALVGKCEPRERRLSLSFFWEMDFSNWISFAKVRLSAYAFQLSFTSYSK